MFVVFGIVCWPIDFLCTLVYSAKVSDHNVLPRYKTRTIPFFAIDGLSKQVSSADSNARCTKLLNARYRSSVPEALAQCLTNCSTFVPQKWGCNIGEPGRNATAALMLRYVSRCVDGKVWSQAADPSDEFYQQKCIVHFFIRPPEYYLQIFGLFQKFTMHSVHPQYQIVSKLDASVADESL